MAHWLLKLKNYNLNFRSANMHTTKEKTCNAYIMDWLIFACNLIILHELYYNVYLQMSCMHKLVVFFEVAAVSISDWGA